MSVYRERVARWNQVVRDIRSDEVLVECTEAVAREYRYTMNRDVLYSKACEVCDFYEHDYYTREQLDRCLLSDGRLPFFGTIEKLDY